MTRDTRTMDEKMADALTAAYVERDALAARVTELEAALREIARMARKPNGVITNEWYWAVQADVLAYARAALAASGADREAGGIGCTCRWDDDGTPIGGKHEASCQMADREAGNG